MGLEALKVHKGKAEPTPEESFRVAVRDVVEFSSKLQELCGDSIKELLAICEPALASDAQARILMQLIGAGK